MVALSFEYFKFILVLRQTNALLSVELKVGAFKIVMDYSFNFWQLTFYTHFVKVDEVIACYPERICISSLRRFKTSVYIFYDMVLQPTGFII